MVLRKIVPLLVLALYLTGPFLSLIAASTQTSGVSAFSCRCCSNYQKCCAGCHQGRHEHFTAEGFCSCTHNADDALSETPANTEAFVRMSVTFRHLYGIPPSDYQSAAGYLRPLEKPPPV